MYFNNLDENQKTQNMVQNDKLSVIKSRVLDWLKESKDPEFSNYLKHILESVKMEESRIEQINADLERNYRLYCQNMQRMAQRQQTMPVKQLMPAQPPSTQQSAPMQQPEPQTTAPVQQSELQTALVQQSEPQTVPVQQSGPQPAPMQQSEPEARPVYIPHQTPIQQQTETKTQNAEFAIGAAVLSVVGSAFILTAMVLFGMYFMQGMMKGMLLYVACIIGMLLAEFVLYRRWPKLGMTISAIGMIGLYISTLVNYLVLHNFNEWIALFLTSGITLFVIVLSRKRDAAAYRVLGIAAMYGCLLLVFQREGNSGGFAPAELATVAMIGLLANIMCVAVPVKKAQTVLDIIHMCLNSLFAGMVYFGWLYEEANGQNEFAGGWQYLFFASASVFVTQMIFVAQIRRKERQDPGGNMGKNLGICIAYCVLNLSVYALLISSLAGFEFHVFGGESGYLFYRIICSICFAVLYLIPVLILKDRQEKWISWYFLCLVVFLVHWNYEDQLELSVCLLILLVISKILSFTRNVMVRNSDVAITSLSCAVVLLAYERSYVVPLFVGIVLSVLCINYWKTYFETILAFTIALYTSLHMLTLLKLPVFVGVLFVAMLIFNNVKRWHGDGIIVFNICALSGSAVCYLMLVNPVYQNAYLTYLCMLIFGVAMIVICFQRQYHLEFEGKYMIMAVFLTYMGLIVRTNYSIVNSILVMLTALACVGVGFYIQKKNLRIYGLVLALLVCCKLVVYDFGGVNTMQKTIVFFAVGLIALTIAAIYMILEKNLEKRNISINVQTHENEEAQL